MSAKVPNWRALLPSSGEAQNFAWWREAREGRPDSVEDLERFLSAWETLMVDLRQIDQIDKADRSKLKSDDGTTYNQHMSFFALQAVIEFVEASTVARSYA